jgi:hypothetical protein
LLFLFERICNVLTMFAGAAGVAGDGTTGDRIAGARVAGDRVAGVAGDGKLE